MSSGSAFQTPLTIIEALDKISHKKYLLPMIQREYVWDDEQIIKLFDSLMRGYPIGSFLFWEAIEETLPNYQFYEFVTNYTEMEETHNPRANIGGEQEITCVLDGQQRLSSLYIGLKGSYAKKIPWKRKDNPDAYPKKKLYVNLLKRAKDEDETGLLYDFRFLTKEEKDEQNEDVFWFEVGKILQFKEQFELNEYLIEKGITLMDQARAMFANRLIYRLFQVIHIEGTITYYLERSQELDKVLNIFVRINSAGTPLDYSDLLLSIASAQWKTVNARDEIIDFVGNINKIGDGFDFDKDFVLKCCLVLSDMTNIAFKVDNFNRKNMQEIEQNWDEIKKAIRISIELVSSLGYNGDTLVSGNSVIPIAYFIKKIGLPNNFVLSRNFVNDRKLIKRWLATSLLMRIFSGQPDNVLRPIREVIRTSDDGFPLDAIVEKLKGTQKSLTVTKEALDGFSNQKYKEPYTFSTLALLYPTFDLRNKFHIDHIFPQYMFSISNLRKSGIEEEKWEEYKKSLNLIGNLQLLEGIQNEEKSSKEPKVWIDENFSEEEKSRYMRRNMIEIDTSLDFVNFLDFVQSRKTLITDRLKEELGIEASTQNS